MAAYPRIYFACHLEHREDPVTRDVISAHQGSVLDHLDAVEPMGLLDLAKHMGVTPSTMSLTVDRLERGGYVTRERDSSDGRRVRLILTPAGVRVKQAASVLDVNRVRGLLERLKPEERERALAGLELLAAAGALEVEGRQGQGRKGGRK
jgi:MarR family transcriptional regulator, organic hydroperoxide resistance regulator